MCLRPRLPQLPVRRKPPNTPPRTEENLQKKNCKIAGFSARSFGKTQLSLQRASFISLCYCICASIQLVFKTSPPFSHSAFDFCLTIQRWHWFRFYSRKRTDKYSPCTSRLGETFPHMPSAAILLLTPSGAKSPLCIRDTYQYSFPSFWNIFFQSCTLNCDLQYGCKVVSSTRLLLFTLSRLPSPRLLSVSAEFKEMLEKREAAGEAFYDFIGPEEALLGRCWTVIVTLSLIMSPQTGTVC